MKCSNSTDVGLVAPKRPSPVCKAAHGLSLGELVDRFRALNVCLNACEDAKGGDVSLLRSETFCESRLIVSSLKARGALLWA